MGAMCDKKTEKAEELQKDIDVLRGVLKLGTVPVVMKRAAELAGIAENSDRQESRYRNAVHRMMRKSKRC